MANNRLAFGLCKEYGIDLPKDATPTDAWKALEDKGITQDEAFQKASKSTKQGTSYDDILKGESKPKHLTPLEEAESARDAAKERMDIYRAEGNQLGVNKAFGEYQKYNEEIDAIKRGDKSNEIDYEEIEKQEKESKGRNYALKKAEEAGLEVNPWEIDDFLEAWDYDGDYSEASIDKYIDKVKAEMVKDDAYSDIVQSDSKKQKEQVVEPEKNFVDWDIDNITTLMSNNQINELNRLNEKYFNEIGKPIKGTDKHKTTSDVFTPEELKTWQKYTEMAKEDKVINAINTGKYNNMTLEEAQEQIYQAIPDFSISSRDQADALVKKYWHKRNRNK